MTLIFASVNDPANLAGAGDAIRTHDLMMRTSWRAIEYEREQYDLSDMRRLAASGKRLIWTIAGTPTFYATNQRPDGYGVPGGAAAVRRTSALRKMVRAVWPVIKDVCDLIEVGNEIEREHGLWAAMVRAVRAELPDALVSAPSYIVGHEKHLKRYLTFDPAPAAVSFHLYNHQCSTKGLAEAIDEAQALVPGARLACTEMGLSPKYDDQRARLPWLTLDADGQARAWMQCAALARKRGLVALGWYGLDQYRLQPAGDLFCMGDKPAFVAAFQRSRGTRAARV